MGDIMGKTCSVCGKFVYVDGCTPTQCRAPKKVIEVEGHPEDQARAHAKYPDAKFVSNRMFRGEWALRFEGQRIGSVVKIPND